MTPSSSFTIWLAVAVTFWFCYSIYYFAILSIAASVDTNDPNASPDVPPGFAFVVFLPLVSVALAWLYFFGQCLTRGEIRRRYAIPGNCCLDCLLSYFCGCCSVTQVSAHTRPGTGINASTTSCCTRTGLQDAVTVDSRLVARIGRMKSVLVRQGNQMSGGDEIV